MTELQIAIAAMCLMGISFAWCVKLLFDAFIVHLRRQSELTDRAVHQAGEAVALNGKMLATLAGVVGTLPDSTSPQSRKER